MPISWLSHQEVEGEAGALWQATTANWATAVWVCLSAFLSVTPLGIFKETLGHFHSFIEWQNWVFLRRLGDISSCLCGDQNQLLFTGSQTIYRRVRAKQNWYLRPNRDVFLTVTKMFSCIKITRALAQNIKLQRKETFIHDFADMWLANMSLSLN